MYGFFSLARHNNLDLFGRGDRNIPLCNDISIGVGFAPLTRTERLTREVENSLNSTDMKSQFPAIGEDIKVMAIRMGKSRRLTIAAAIVARFVDSSATYLQVIRAVRDMAADAASRAGFQDSEFSVNIVNAEVMNLPNLWKETLNPHVS